MAGNNDGFPRRFMVSKQGLKKLKKVQWVGSRTSILSGIFAAIQAHPQGQEHITLNQVQAAACVKSMCVHTHWHPPFART